MSERLHDDWLHGRASLGAASGWTTEEIRLIADLGHALAEQGREQEAITIFEGLAALAPATGYFQSALGALRLRTGDAERALEHLDAALVFDPQDIAALVNRGEARLHLGERAIALNDLTVAVRLGETSVAGASALYVARARALLARWSNPAR